MSSEPLEINDFLLDYRKLVETSAARLLELSEEQSKVAKYPGKWSAREIVGHLIDSAANNHQRFVRAQFSEELAFPTQGKRSQGQRRAAQTSRAELRHGDCKCVNWTFGKPPGMS